MSYEEKTYIKIEGCTTLFRVVELPTVHGKVLYSIGGLKDYKIPMDILNDSAVLRIVKREDIVI